MRELRPPRLPPPLRHAEPCGWFLGSSAARRSFFHRRRDLFRRAIGLKSREPMTEARSTEADPGAPEQPADAAPKRGPSVAAATSGGSARAKANATAGAAGEDSPLSEVADANAYKVTLPSFEGPLDLLLHLCQKHELD